MAKGLTAFLFAAPLLMVPAFALAQQKLAALDPAQKLSTTQSELKEAESRYRVLQEDAEELQEEMEALQDQLVEVSGQQREREQRLLELESKQSALTQRIEQNRGEMKSREAEISRLLQSLVRLAQMPPGAVIAMPGNIRKTMLAATLLEETSHQLQRQTDSLKTRLSLLEEDSKALKTTHAALKEELEEYNASQQTLNAKIDDRSSLQSRLDQQQASEKQRISQLAAQSRSLQQLISKLEEERNRPPSAKLRAIPMYKPKSVPPTPQELASLQPAAKAPSPALPDSMLPAVVKGNMALPVVGNIVKVFGQKDHPQSKSEGLTIRSRPGAQVVAPSGGEVIFTGPFMDYGRMVIIRHQGNYVSLLAGLEDVQCSVGQRLRGGEPVGRMGSGNNGLAELYMELRKNRQPIDPAPWLSKTLS